MSNSLTEQLKSTVPAGNSGDWRVETFTVLKQAAEGTMLSAAINHRPWEYVPAGEYTRLCRGFTTVMSDTPSELSDLRVLRYNAQNLVLINGLGLGCAAQLCMDNKCVTKVTVIERSPDVIALVAVHLKGLPNGEKLEIIEDNAFTYKPPKHLRYGAVWHDIWDDICKDNWPQMKTLHRRYGHKTIWQGSWSRERIQPGRV